MYHLLKHILKEKYVIILSLNAHVNYFYSEFYILLVERRCVDPCCVCALTGIWYLFGSSCMKPLFIVCC